MTRKDLTSKTIKASNDIVLGKLRILAGTTGKVLGYNNGFVQVKWDIKGETVTFCDQLDVEVI